MGANISYPTTPPGSGDPGGLRAADGPRLLPHQGGQQQQHRLNSMVQRYTSHTFLTPAELGVSGVMGSPSPLSSSSSHYHYHDLASSSSSPSNSTPSKDKDKKKSKISKLATLRKKLTRVRRSSRNFDHSKAIRDLTSSWSVRDLSGLVDEYEASIVLKELAMLASLARPHANSIKEDLSRLYDCKYCTDVDLVYAGEVFPVHRAILSVRCPYFRDLLLRYPEYGIQIPVQIRTAGVDVHMFSALLRYLYTGDFVFCDADKANHLRNLALLRKLAEEFGTPNPLEHDLRNLLETGMFSDALLIFTPAADPDAAPHYPASPAPPEATRLPKHELRCHKAILAARSPFFRALLARRGARNGDDVTERCGGSGAAPTCIVLDESVIPRRYARVLLHAVYLDAVDLSCIVRTSVSMCSLSEVQAMVAGGGGRGTLMDEAMEIYQIGQFLDFPMLSQGCEDLVLDSLSVDTLTYVLHWSREAHGSAWVHRQALHFLKEEFLAVAHSPVLTELNHSYMLHAVKSDFLQAGEVDILAAVLKWGEHQLMKRIENREPNLLSHTAHSVSKKGIRKRDLNDVELREILAELLPHVRVDHVIPHHAETLTAAVKRALVSVPPSHMLADSETSSHSTVAAAWVRSSGHSGMFVKPRLFLPYYEEVKAQLEEQLSQVQENDGVRLRGLVTHHHSPGVTPDALYMVDAGYYSPATPAPAQHGGAATVDIISGTIPVPDAATLSVMLRRECELARSALAARAYGARCADRPQVTHQLQLRVVREVGMPDSTVEVLRRQHSAAAPRTPPCSVMAHHNLGGGGGNHGNAGHAADHGMEHVLLNEARYHTPRRVRQRCQHTTGASPGVGGSGRGVTKSPQYTLHHEKDGVAGGDCPVMVADGTLSDLMPDIAMATASVNQLSLHDHMGHAGGGGGDLELDLGDGSNHSSSAGTLYI